VKGCSNATDRQRSAATSSFSPHSEP
jgi:hypothetical protein